MPVLTHEYMKQFLMNFVENIEMQSVCCLVISLMLGALSWLCCQAPTILDSLLCSCTGCHPMVVFLEVAFTFLSFLWPLSF